MISTKSLPKNHEGPSSVSISLNKNSEEAKIYLYSIIVLCYNCFKSNPLCRSQDSNCGHTNSSVQMERYIWQVSLFLKIASWIFLIIKFFGRHWCWHEGGAWKYYVVIYPIKHEIKSIIFSFFGNIFSDRPFHCTRQWGKFLTNPLKEYMVSSDGSNMVVRW